MPDPHSRAVLVWRWAVFLLAAFFSVHTITTSSYAGAGGPFRYLTHWALLLSFYAASRMLAYTEHRVPVHGDTVPAVASVLNAMVVYLYWSLFLKDPALVRSGAPPAWWDEYYKHALGPALQWIDALFVRGAFGRPARALLGIAVVVVAYLAWIELFVGPLNDSPVGTATSGLPYPFLNDMEPPARALYYATVSAGAVLVLGAFTALAWGIRRLRGAQ